MRRYDDESSPEPLRSGGWLPPLRAGRHAAEPAAEVTPAGTRVVPAVPARIRRHKVVPVWHRRRTLGIAAVVSALVVVIGAPVAVNLFSGSPAAVPPVRQPAAVPVPEGPGAPVPAFQTPLPATASASATARPATAPPAAGPPSVARATPSRTRRPSPATNTTPAPVRLSYEAERAANVLGGRAGAGPLDGTSGGRIVGTVGLGDANFLRFTGVTVPDAGSYPVRIHYITGEPRRATILVNGRAATTLAFASTGSWRTVGTTTVRLTLRAGANTIQFGHSTDPCPDFDRIDVTR
jgi:hypothetical protein